MADEQGTIATAQNGTAQGDTTQPLATDTQQPQEAQQKPALDLEKELQRNKSQMGREAAEAKRAAQAAHERAAAAERQIRDARLANMDDLERSKFERDEAFQYAESVRRQAAADAQNLQRERDIADLMQEYGAPREAFDDATDYADAVRKGRAYEKAQREAQIEEAVAKRLQKAEANAPDLGGGRPSTPSSRKNDRTNEFLREKDAKNYVLEILKSRNK